MDLPTPEVRDGLVAGLMAIIGYCWKKLNGTLSKQEFKEWCERYEARAEVQRKEFRDTLISIFDEIKVHIGNDQASFVKIEHSLGRLEERANSRRKSDT